MWYKSAVSPRLRRDKAIWWVATGRCFSFCLTVSTPLPQQSRSIQRIEATTLGERKVAVRRFSGRWSDQNFADEAMHLLASLTEHGFTTTGPVSFAFYDAPSVHPAKRYNEVQIEVE
jgi:hypothetical protein